MLNKDLIEKLDLKDPAVWLATWGGCGFFKKAPGTWGTLGALPFGVAIMVWGGWQQLLCAGLIVFYFGWRAAKKFEEMSGTHDHGAIVVDEAAGLWVVLLVTPVDLMGIIMAFVFFRFFDIVKPWPVSYFDKMPGARGVMLDDIMAGVYAALCVLGARHAGVI